MRDKPRVLDLFCGAGGMSLGFQNAGCEIIGGIEHEHWPHETHKNNFPHCKVKVEAEDIQKLPPGSIGLEPDEVDILIGGPPCQGFSVVGQGKIRHLGLERDRDVKNRLYKQFIKYLNHFQPAYFVIENVQGMKMFKKHSFLTKVITELENAGYVVDKKVLTATDFGVPQTRHRLFIIGRRKDCPGMEIKLLFPVPNTTTPITVGQAISDLRKLDPLVLKPKIKGRLGNSGAKHVDAPVTYRYKKPKSEYQKLMREGNGETVMNHICRGHNEKDLKIFGKLKEGGKYIDLPKRDRRYRDDIFKDKYRKLKWEAPSWTLTAHMQRDCLAYIHPRENRSLSTREAARIQSFPDRFVFAGPLTKVFRQIGNAVPPLLAENVAKGIVAEWKQNQSIIEAITRPAIQLKTCVKSSATG